MHLSNAKKLIAIFSFIYITLFSAFSEESTNQTQENQSEEVAPSGKNAYYNAVVFLKDVLDDKYPFRIDFGAEPHRHGSMIFGSIWYDWNNMFSSSIRGEYDHYMTFENAGDEVKTNEVQSISFIPFPVVLFFGNPDISARSIFTEIDIGFYFKNSHSSTNEGSYSDFSTKGFQLTETDTNYNMLGPAFNISLEIPLMKYISVKSEFFFVPFYVLSTKSKTKMHDSTRLESNSVEGVAFSSPYLKQSLCIDFFRYIRIKSQITYQHIDMRQSVVETASDAKYSSHKLILRYGGELQHPSKTRKKSAHLWAGLYYEMTWEKNYSSAESTSDYSGKWLLCFGT